MTDSSLTQLSIVEESTWGITPTTPDMKLLRFTQEDLNFNIGITESNEIVSDRQVTDLIQTGASAVGGYQFELSFREHDENMAGAFMSSWVLSMEKDNNGTADSKITDIGTTSNTFVVDSLGANFKVGHLVRATGNTNAANNLIFRVTSSTATTVVGTALSLVAETAPPGTSRLKVVGFQGASGDITATATGLGSTSLNFTTLGLVPGQWIKIGGTAVGDKFGTASCNDWVRVTVIAATALTVDNRPATWTTDSGSGKTIKVWFGDQLSNGSTVRSFTIQKGFLGQTVPNYLPFSGLTFNNFSLEVVPARPVTGAFTVLGKTVGPASTTSLDSTPTASRTGDVLNGVTDVGRIAEAGVTVTSPNYVQQFSFETTNNLRELTAVGVLGLVNVGKGKFRVTGRWTTYFEDATVYNKIVANTETSVSIRIGKAGQAYVFQLPRVKLSAGTPQAGGGDQDVVIAADFTAIKDTTLTQKTAIVDRVEYYE